MGIQNPFASFQLPTVPTPQAAPPPDMQAQLMQMLMQQQRPQDAPIDFASLFSGLRNDPQGDANKAYIPGKGGGPWAGPLEFGSTPSGMSPEAALASQRGSAMSQWGSLGGLSNINVDKLNRFKNQQTPLPSGGSSYESINQFSDPFFIRRQQGNPYSDMFQGTPGQGQLPGGAAPDMATMMSRLGPNSIDASHSIFSNGTISPDPSNLQRFPHPASPMGSPQPGFQFQNLFGPGPAQDAVNEAARANKKMKRSTSQTPYPQPLR